MMLSFRAFLNYEAKSFFSVRNTVIVVLLLFLGLGFIQYGVNVYKDNLEKKSVFQDSENERVKQFFNYRVYGLYGFRLLAEPHPMAIFFINSTSIPGMTAYCDSGERLRIYKSLQGGAVFEVRKNWFTDFSGIILFFLGLLVLLYGYEAFVHCEFIRFLAPLMGKTRLFLSVLAARAILVLLLLVFLTGCAVLLIRLNGIYFPMDKYIVIYALVTYLTAVFLLVTGSIFGSWKNKILGLSCAIITWFICLFIIPTALNIIVASKADNITPVYLQEIEKLKIV
ncbi:MAG: hypothetical protein GY950_33125, partial [bacterium]|nr:hypothetical protein [bacterium]